MAKGERIEMMNRGEKNKEETEEGNIKRKKGKKGGKKTFSQCLSTVVLISSPSIKVKIFKNFSTSLSAARKNH